MRVLFIYSDLFPSYPGWTGHFYVGIASLSATLRRAGHETALLHVCREFSGSEEFIASVKGFSPGLIAFSSTTLTYKYVRVMAGWLHEARLGVPVIAGGIHSTLEPIEVLNTPGIDMACAGDGELALSALAEALQAGKDYKGIRGVWVRDGNTIHENGMAPIVHDLDDLPYPDRSIFDYPNLVQEREGRAVFMASRGCPYQCTYCSNHLLQRIMARDNPGKTIRFRSVDNLIGEITRALGEHPFIKELHFEDDVFFLKKKWAEEFAAKYPGAVGLPFTCNMRPNHMSPEIAGLLKEAGCVEVKIGLESGNERIRNHVLKRNLTDDQMYNAFRYCHEAGIRVHTYNMLGVPFETSAAILDTIKMNARAGSDRMQVSIFYPMPKTELYDICVKEGFIFDSSGYDFYTAMLDIRTVSKKRVKYFYWSFRRLVALYSLAYRLGPALSSRAVGAIDAVVESPFFNLIGWAALRLNKAKVSLLRLKARIRSGKARAEVVHAH